MSKKAGEKQSRDNNFGVVGVTFGILSIIFSSAMGLVIGIVGLVFAMKQKKKHSNKWSKNGIVLNIVGIILGIAFMIFAITQAIIDPGLFSQFKDLG
jgi:uncharacterized membrane protein HdeD (DUF308 family)